MTCSQVVDPARGVQTPMECLWRHGCVAVDLQSGQPVAARQMEHGETVMATLRFFKSSGDGLVVVPRRVMQQKQICDGGSRPLHYWQDRLAPACTTGCMDYCVPEPLTERRQPVVSLSGVTVFEGERPEIAMFDTERISGRVDRSAVVTRNMEAFKTAALVRALNITSVETKTLSINATFPTAYPTWRPNNPFNVYNVDVDHTTTLWSTGFRPPNRTPNVTCVGPVFSPTFPDSAVQTSKCPTEHPAAQVGAHGTADFSQVTTPLMTASGTSPKIPYGNFTDADLVFFHDDMDNEFDMSDTYDESSVRFVVIGGATSLVTEQESLRMSWLDIFLELGALWGIVELVCGFLVKEFEGWMRSEIDHTRRQLRTARLLQRAAYANEVAGSARTSLNADLDDDGDSGGEKDLEKGAQHPVHAGKLHTGPAAYDSDPAGVDSAQDRAERVRRAHARKSALGFTKIAPVDDHVHGFRSMREEYVLDRDEAE
ncbi:unnamed protein product [Pedinophyceae sp. YPF-701]|nr:unnamed protein product [Pedinophyceae sp. YPF-701]